MDFLQKAELRCSFLRYQYSWVELKEAMLIEKLICVQEYFQLGPRCVCFQISTHEYEGHNVFAG